MMLLLFSCANLLNINQEEWTINEDYIRDGCFAGKDCIPSIDSPRYSNIGGNNLEFLDDDDLVVGLWDGSNYIAYPHPILDWHEIVNENEYSISYCPLTGSAIHFETSSEFGVSGKLFNSNLIMYDRKSDSYWPQMLLRSAAGKKQNEHLNLLPLLETTWGSWKKLFPDTIVLNSNTNYNRDYNRYPYGDYKNCSSLACSDYIYFPVENSDDQIPAKERVITIIDGNKTIAAPINSYNAPTIIKKTLNNNSYTLIISSQDNIAIAFKTNKDLSIGEWNISNGKIVLKETSTGKQWNLLGQPLSGTSTNEELPSANSYIAYWFSVAAFFPNVEIIE